MKEAKSPQSKIFSNSSVYHSIHLTYKSTVHFTNFLDFNNANATAVQIAKAAILAKVKIKNIVNMQLPPNDIYLVLPHKKRCKNREYKKKRGLIRNLFPLLILTTFKDENATYNNQYKSDNCHILHNPFKYSHPSIT